MITLLLLACIPRHTLTYDGLEREYYLHVPDELPEGAPLVLFLHGLGGNARLYSLLGMRRQADELGFVVVFPQGTDDDRGRAHWNAQLTLSEVDDIGFLSELAAQLQREYGLDPARTYTSGISNGGFMSYALVCQAPDVFHAAGSVIGTMSGETWSTCPEIPAPILQISGTDDDVVPIDGSLGPKDGWGGAPEIPAVVQRWVGVNGCTEQVAVDVGDRNGATTGTRYTGCESGSEVLYFEVEGMGHELPGWDWDAELARFLMAL